MLKVMLQKEQGLGGCDMRILIGLNDGFVILRCIVKKIYNIEKEIPSYSVTTKFVSVFI